MHVYTTIFLVDFCLYLVTTVQTNGVRRIDTSMALGNRTIDLIGVTSWSYHISMWILVAAGIIGNGLVIVWRCSRKESKLSLLSVLIVSLALADLCFCSHYLLQEVMLASPIFGSHNQTSFKADERFCLCVKFLANASVCAIMLLVLAITLYAFFTLQQYRCAKPFIAGFVCCSWIVCLVTGAVSTWQLKDSGIGQILNSRMELRQLSLIVVFDCVDADSSRGASSITVILTTMNAVSSLVVTVLYACVWIKFRKSAFNLSHSATQEILHFRIRLTVISALSLLCWWPVCIVYWLTVFKDLHVYDGTFTAVAQPILVFTAATTVANPIIYTLATKRFFKAVGLAWKGYRSRRNELRLLIPPIMEEAGHQYGLGCRLFSCQRKELVVVVHPETATEETDDTSLFTESN